MLGLKFKQLEQHSFRIRERKTNKPRTIRVSEALKTMIAEYKGLCFYNQRDYIFSVRAGKPMSRTTAYRHLKAAAVICNLEHISPHSLRKTYAINQFIDSGGNLEYVQELLNHKYSITTLSSYILSGVDNSQLASIMSVLTRT